MSILESSHFSNAKLAFIGCGVMAESIIAGLLNNEMLKPSQISISHPRQERREELKSKYGVNIFAGNANAAESVQDSENSLVVICVKPQKMSSILNDLSEVSDEEMSVLSIVAGTRIETIREKLGTPCIFRAMPNTPSKIGHGVSVWTGSKECRNDEEFLVKSVLESLGKEFQVESEKQIDMATSLSATGPTYIFLVMEALTDAGVHLGFSRDLSKDLVQEMILGSVLYAMDSDKHPAELRNLVTSPGGTSADAIYEMEKGSLRTVLSKAVFAAYQKAVRLGDEE